MRDTSEVISRVHGEYYEVKTRLDNLKEFLRNEQPECISDEVWYLLGQQKRVMQDYLFILGKRLSLLA